MGSALEFMMQGDTIVFTSALVFMLLIGIIEAIGLGGSAVHIDTHVDADASLLGWLGIGRLPLLILLVVFLAAFGVIGLSFQQLMVSLTGGTLTAWIVAPLSAVAALPVTGFLARGLARIIPRDETTAVSIDSLIGRTAVIVTGRATQGFPARASVQDHYGHTHYVMAEPDNPGKSFGEGEEIILVRRENHVFRAISEGRTLIPQLDN